VCRRLTSMPNAIRLALIGCGGNMRNAHVPRLLRHGAAEFVACVEPNKDCVDELRRKDDRLRAIPDYDAHAQMLREVQPDAVVISTPHTAHFRHVMDSLEAGCHVLVEKPMVCSTQEARQVVAAAEATGKVVSVSYQRHYQGLFQRMRELVLDGELGALQFLTALQNQAWYANRLKGLGWRHVPELSGGGQLNDSGSHLIDILLHVTGLEPKRVHCLQQNFKLAVDVNAAISVEFTEGTLGSINIVGNGPGIKSSVWEDLTLYGEAGALFYRMMGQPDHKPTLEWRKFDLEHPLPVGSTPPDSDPDTNFLDAVRGEAQVLTPPTCGLRTIQLTEAAWESARRGAVVDVDEL